LLNQRAYIKILALLDQQLPLKTDDCNTLRFHYHIMRMDFFHSANRNSYIEAKPQPEITPNGSFDEKFPSHETRTDSFAFWKHSDSSTCYRQILYYVHVIIHYYHTLYFLSLFIVTVN